MTNQHTIKQKEKEEDYKRRWANKIRVYTVRMPQEMILQVDNQVREGKYMSRSEFIRIAIRELLKEEES